MKLKQETLKFGKYLLLLTLSLIFIFALAVSLYTSLVIGSFSFEKGFQKGLFIFFIVLLIMVPLMRMFRHSYIMEAISRQDEFLLEQRIRKVYFLSFICPGGYSLLGFILFFTTNSLTVFVSFTALSLFGLLVTYPRAVDIENWLSAFDLGIF